MSRRLAPAALALALTLGAAPAPGDAAPSHWDRAKDPRVGEDWDLHMKVAEWLVHTHRESSNERHRKQETARVWLEEAHAEASPDVRLRFDLGEVYESLNQHMRAVEVLAPALAQEPDHPASVWAWEELAAAYAHLDRSRDEIASYDAYLARTLSIDGRATVLSNRAEAKMRLGDLDEAIAGYRDAIAAAESISAQRGLMIADVLARWGLAVALDRSGDPTGAAREAVAAGRLETSVTSQPAGAMIDNRFEEIVVFFVPDYEKFYYLGLGMTERAKQATDPRAAAGSREAAERMWAQYVAGAEAWNASHKDRPDRWLTLAKAHLATAHKQRLAAERRVRSP